MSTDMNDKTKTHEQIVRDAIQKAVSPYLFESVSVDPEDVHRAAGTLARRLHNLVADPDSNVEGYRMEIAATASTPVPQLTASLTVRPQAEMINIEIVKTVNER